MFSGKSLFLALEGKLEIRIQKKHFSALGRFCVRLWEWNWEWNWGYNIVFCFVFFWFVFFVFFVGFLCFFFSLDLMDEEMGGEKDMYKAI